jgi:hypothetical protein
MEGVSPSRWLDVAAFDIAITSCVAFFLWIATDLAHYDVGDIRDDVEWRRALHHYASAPLALAPIAAGLVLIAFPLSGIIVPTLLIGLFGFWWLETVLITYVIRNSLRASVGFAILLPPVWLIIAIASLMVGGLITSIFAILFKLR